MNAERGLLIRIVYLLIAIAWWIGTGFGRLGRGAALVLAYHSVGAAQRERFRWQMAHIGQRAIDVDELTTGAATTRWSLPKVCVTFDDGFACVVENALPIAEEFGIPITIFAVTGNLGRTPGWRMAPAHPDALEPVMTADQIRAAARRAHCRFGSHTVTHPPLVEVPSQQARTELFESRRTLEQILGCTIRDFAAPYGEMDARAIAAARSAGYRWIFTLDPCCHPGPLPQGVVARFSMSPDLWRIEFLLAVAGAYAWLRPWRLFLRRLRAIRSGRVVPRPAIMRGASSSIRV